MNLKKMVPNNHLPAQDLPSCRCSRCSQAPWTSSLHLFEQMDSQELRRSAVSLGAAVKGTTQRSWRPERRGGDWWKGKTKIPIMDSGQIIATSQDFSPEKVPLRKGNPWGRYRWGRETSSDEDTPRPRLIFSPCRRRKKAAPIYRIHTPSHSEKGEEDEAHDGDEGENEAPMTELAEPLVLIEFHIYAKDACSTALNNGVGL